MIFTTQFLDFRSLIQHLPSFVWIYILVILAVLVDLGTALHYAKQARLPIMSNKMRRTIDKLIRYFGLLFIGSIIDVIAIIVDMYPTIGLSNLPLVTAAAAILLCLIEAKSIYEHRDKDRRKLLRKTAESLLTALGQDRAKAFTEFLFEDAELQATIKDAIQKHNNESKSKQASQGATQQ